MVSTTASISLQVKDGEQNHILIVEKTDDTREILGMYFTNIGHEVTLVHSAEMALDILETQKNLPNLIITELVFPGLSGIDMIRKIKSNKRIALIPIVVFTAHSEYSAESLNIKGIPVFYKPFGFDGLEKHVRTITSKNSPNFIPNDDRKVEKEIILPVQQSIIVVNEKILDAYRSDPLNLRRVDPFIFERIVAELFEEEGYKIAMTPPRADGGKDIYVYKKDPITDLMFLVECKRYVPPNTVGVEIARQLFGVVQQERANGGIIVTTSYFTKPAKDFAESVPYQLFLRDFDYLSSWIGKNTKMQE